MSPTELADRDHATDPKPFMECLDNYIEFKVLAMLYGMGLTMPPCDPYEGRDYWGRRVELMLKISAPLLTSSGDCGADR